MANILGFDVEKLIGNLGGQFQKLVGDNPFPALGGDHENPFAGIGGGSPGNPFAGVGGGAFANPFQNFGVSNENPFGTFREDGGNPFGTFDTGQGNPFGTFGTPENPFAGLFGGTVADHATNVLPKPAPGIPAVPGVQQPGSGPVQGLEPGVAQWDGQVQSTFADLGGWVPNAMLAIIQHESHGIPTAQNPYASAHGLFQQLDLTSNDPQVQMQAAKQLAQQKLASIQQSYAANGLNPDERTRARDLFLAWAGHFDYATGQPNPNSSDLGSGQRADQFLSEIMPMYDNIARGRQQPAAGGNSGQAGSMAGVTPGVGGQIMQEFGPTEYAQAHPSTYAYGNAYGLAGSQHPGVDWAVPAGTRVATPLGGTVSVVGNDHGSGYYYTDTTGGGARDGAGEYAVTLDNGDILILGHMSRIDARVGQRVNAGDFIGLSGGSDGDHVHVEYRQRQADGSYRIVDPRQYLK